MNARLSMGPGRKVFPSDERRGMRIICSRDGRVAVLTKESLVVSNVCEEGVSAVGEG